MNVLLVVPIQDQKKTINLVPPLGLGYLATALWGKGHHVEILDCVKERLDAGGFRDYIKKSRPDAVGFTAFSSDLENVKKSLRIVKEISPSIISIVGALAQYNPLETSGEQREWHLAEFRFIFVYLQTFLDTSALFKFAT